MARSENPELKRKLRVVLQERLCEYGLDATSYQVIADEAGTSRALVQHYYPRKMDFAIEFLNRLLTAIAKMLGIDDYAEKETLSYADAHLIGCLYYGFLLDVDGGQPLLFDILKNRELADELMYLHYQWGLTYLDSDRPSFESRPQEVIETWGGFYELMYRSIEDGFEIDVASKTISLLATFADISDTDLLLGANDGRTCVDARMISEIKATMREMDAAPTSARCEHATTPIKAIQETARP